MYLSDIKLSGVTLGIDWPISVATLILIKHSVFIIHFNFYRAGLFYF